MFFNRDLDVKYRRLMLYRYNVYITEQFTFYTDHFLWSYLEVCNISLTITTIKLRQLLCKCRLFIPRYIGVMAILIIAIYHKL